MRLPLGGGGDFFDARAFGPTQEIDHDLLLGLARGYIGCFGGGIL
jgi:hypothetical protein